MCGLALCQERIGLQRAYAVSVGVGTGITGQISKEMVAALVTDNEEAEVLFSVIEARRLQAQRRQQGGE